MPRRVFFSFHFDNDCWRTQQVRNINALEGQPLLSPNEWEEVQRSDAAIKKWIADQMYGKSCVVVLVGAHTANRPWVIHEISEGWNAEKGVLGIRVHKLLDSQGRPSAAGPNPFEKVKFTGTSRSLASVAELVDPAGYDSKTAYASIVNNVEAWVENAIRIRNSST